MKKTLIAAAALAMVASVCAVGCDTNGNVKDETVTITFVQTGQDNVVKTISKGSTLTDIPSPVDRTGYTVTWNVTDFVNVSSDVTVTAVETANEYTITYQPGDGTLDSITQKVTYDADYTLKVPVNNDESYTFSCWTRSDNTSVAQTGTWKIAEDVTLTAVYNEPYTITFVQTGYEAVVIKVVEGGSLEASDIPQPHAEEGYTVVWDKNEFVNVTQSMTVNAIKTAKDYTITYNLGDCAEDENATITDTTQTVKYNDPFNLYIPSCYGYKFVKWVKTGTDTEVKNGTWNIADDVSLTAVWEIDENSDRWWSENE